MMLMKNGRIILMNGAKINMKFDKRYVIFEIKRIKTELANVWEYLDILADDYDLENNEEENPYRDMADELNEIVDALRCFVLAQE